MFEANLDYIVNSKLACAAELRSLLKKIQTKPCISVKYVKIKFTVCFCLCCGEDQTQGLMPVRQVLYYFLSFCV